MGANLLDVRYGDRNTLPYYNGIVDPTVVANPSAVAAVKAGTVMSLTSGGFLTPGVSVGSIPFFAVSGYDLNNYPDVQRDAGMPTNADLPNNFVVASLTLVGAGTGYAIGDLVQVNVVGTASPVTIRVLTLATTAIATFTLVTGGSFVTAPTGTAVATTALTGGGSGATFTVATSAAYSGRDPLIALPTLSGATGATFATIRHNAAVELATTNFSVRYAYTPGTALTAVSAAGTIGVRGMIRPQNAATDLIVGYVAPAGRYVAPSGYPTLAFTPAFVAGTTVVAVEA
jgi:hypothetical protein